MTPEAPSRDDSSTPLGRITLEGVAGNVGTAVAAGLKHVEVIISSDVPVDVSILDGNADWMLTEEISGTKTCKNDIDSNSGLLVGAVDLEMTGNVSIEVYENGQFKTQDTDWWRLFSFRGSRRRSARPVRGSGAQSPGNCLRVYYWSGRVYP